MTLMTWTWGSRGRGPTGAAGAAAGVGPGLFPSRPPRSTTAAAPAAQHRKCHRRWQRSSTHCPQGAAPAASQRWQPEGSSRQRSARHRVQPHAAAEPQPPGASQQREPTFAEVMNDIFAALAAAQQQPATTPGAYLSVEGLTFQPPGAPQPLLRDINITVAPNTLGIIFGRSGAGKTTLLQAVAGLCEPGGGAISFTGPLAGGTGTGRPLPAEARMAAAGLVFQFPERHFIGRTLGEELTVGWPSGLSPAGMAERQARAARAYQVLAGVGLAGLPLDAPLAPLSDGYKRRVALAVQLVRRPSLLLLDEPLAGLDWRTRAELISVLRALKSECTMVVVSHDLRELAPLADSAWCMAPGGQLQPCALDDLPY